MRGCGKQGVATIVIFVGYYILALPIGISLLYLTDMGTYGKCGDRCQWCMLDYVVDSEK